MNADQVVEQRAGCRLAAFRHPEARQRNAEIRAPKALEVLWYPADRHHATRRAGNQHRLAAGACIGNRIRAENAKATSVSIDQSRCDPAGLRQPEVFRRLRRQRAEIAAYRGSRRGQSAALQQIGQSYGRKEILEASLAAHGLDMTICTQAYSASVPCFPMRAM